MTPGRFALAHPFGVAARVRRAVWLSTPAPRAVVPQLREVSIEDLRQNARSLWEAAGALGFQNALWSERAADVRASGGLLQ